ncbi:unnamed protein product [Heterobilharzia americana]|nr:unnamed protein product [Heterobilharzia americana]
MSQQSKETQIFTRGQCMNYPVKAEKGMEPCKIKNAVLFQNVQLKTGGKLELLSLIFVTHTVRNSAQDFEIVTTCETKTGGVKSSIRAKLEFDESCSTTQRYYESFFRRTKMFTFRQLAHVFVKSKLKNEKKRELLMSQSHCFLVLLAIDLQCVGDVEVEYFRSGFHRALILPGESLNAMSIRLKSQLILEISISTHR